MEKSVFTSEYELLRRLLREFRKRTNVTQEDLAARLKETQSFVSKCERGERRLDLVQLHAFCKALGIPLLDFVQEYVARLTHRRQASGGRVVPNTKVTRP